MAEHYLTGEIAGIGGSVKEAPDDFRVEEIPLYLPCGEGEHLFIAIEKSGLTTHQLIRHCADTFSVKEKDIGYAGLKDSNATTVQSISVPLVEPAAAEQIENDQIRILSARRHRNKLRPGHLAGNRFHIRIRNPQPDPMPLIEEILAVIGRKGLPNYFGEQRYGVLGNSHLIGQAIVQGDFEAGCRLIVGDPAIIEHPGWKRGAELFLEGKPEQAIESLPRHCRYEKQLLTGLARGQSHKKSLLNLPRNILRLYLSAFQSSLFDRVVDMRLATLDKIWAGDVAIKHVNGACFRVENPAVEQERADDFEISATGPLYGHTVMLAGGQSGILEEALLDKFKLSLADFKLGRGLAMSGERRALRVPVSDLSARMIKEDLLVTFALPKGSYATSLLRELIKPAPLSEPN